MEKKLPVIGLESKYFSVGSDPEMFVFSKKKLLPAFEFLPSKRRPLDTERVQLYWDGFQAEFKQVDCGGDCLEVLRDDIQNGLYELSKHARKLDENAKLSLKNVVRIPTETLDTAKDPFVALGCDPSFNVYGLEGKHVQNPRKLRYRFAGGHMHFGLPEGTQHNSVEQIVKSLDAIVGVWSIGAAQSFDSPVRRQYYGLAGEHRLPIYEDKTRGVEYRVLSNFWLSHPAIMMITWEIARQAVRLALSDYYDQWLAPQEEVIEAIQNCDVKLARVILKRNKPMFRWMFRMKGWDEQVQKAFNLGLDGIESKVKDPEDIEKNWLIRKEDLCRDRYDDSFYPAILDSSSTASWESFASDEDEAA